MSTVDQQPVLSVRNVTKSFGDNRAVDGVNLDIRKGEIFGFLGPNGAGKSTTIRLILDILRPDSGTITILGRSNRETSAVHKDIGYLSGDMVFDTGLTGQKYLAFINNLYGGNHVKTTAKLAEFLEVDLNKKIGAYSRGNRQKIGLIAALLHNPKLLILDEPTSGFDPLVQEKFAEIIRVYIARGGTVFMSSHILAEIQRLCNRVAFIRAGRIVRTTRVKDLLDVAKRVIVTAPTDELQRLKNNYGAVDGLVAVPSHGNSLEFSYSGDINELLSLLSQYIVHDLIIREPELDEVFAQYYEPVPPRNKEAA